MKKVLALVLAVMMLAAMGTMAFAAEVYPSAADNGNTIDVNPGDKIVLVPGLFTPLYQKTANYDFDSAHFTVTAKKFDKGANLVESVEIDDDLGAIVITLKQDYALEQPKKENLSIEKLEIKCKKTTGSVTRNETFALDSGYSSFRVGYVFAETNLDPAPTISAAGAYKFVKANNVSYATATIDLANICYGEVRVYNDEKVNLVVSQSPDLAVVKAYPDADLTFVNFKSGTFSSNVALELYADEDSYLYELKNGKPVASSLKWDDEAYAFTGKVRTLGNYIISDTKLPVSAEEGNPDTGANDVVGIATALAAVALVSAAAVSLKK